MQEFDLALRWVHFPLHPGLPAEGVPLSELFRAKGLRFDVAAANARLAAVAEGVGLPFHPPQMAWDTRLAQELSAWATTLGDTSLHDRLFRAVFVDGVNVGDPEVLLRLVGDVGLPVDEARAVLSERRMKAAVDQDWQYARQIGVTGVPTYVVDRRGVVGAQPLEVLERLAVQAGAARRVPK